VDRVAVLCQVSSEIVVDSAAAARTLCNRVKVAAARGAPVPVVVVTRSDAALRAPRTAVLFVQASITQIAPARLALILTARAERNDATEETRTLFGSAPRVATFTSPDDGAAWDAVIAASLSEVLPWLNRADTNDLLPKD
jgi:nucleotide-binding universal stress UspA family protein